MLVYHRTAVPLWGISKETFPVLQSMDVAASEVEIGVEHSRLFMPVRPVYPRVEPEIRDRYKDAMGVAMPRGDGMRGFLATVRSILTGSVERPELCAAAMDRLPAGATYRTYYGPGCVLRMARRELQQRVRAADLQLYETRDFEVPPVARFGGGVNSAEVCEVRAVAPRGMRQRWRQLTLL